MSTKLIEAVGQIGERVDEITGDLRGRVEALEARNNCPGKTGLSREQDEYKGAFLDWVRRPSDKVYERRLSEAVHDLRQKDATIGVAGAGGYAVPEEIRRQVETRERQLNPFIDIVATEVTSTNDYKGLVSLGDGTAGWSSETGTRTATNTPTLRERAPTMGEQYALPRASNWALADVFFNVQKWLVEDVAAEWSSQLATAIISGDGSNKPTGILNGTPVTTADDASPIRSAEVIQYIPSDSASPVSLHLDDVIDLVANVKEKYLDQESCAFVMHRLTAAHLRKLRDSSGSGYLWQPSTQLGQPDLLLGYPVYSCDAMGLFSTADAHAVLFGNFRRGYLLARRTGMEITVDPYSTPGYTRFFVRRRIGGILLNNDCIKALKIADS